MLWQFYAVLYRIILTIASSIDFICHYFIYKNILYVGYENVY